MPGTIWGSHDMHTSRNPHFSAPTAWPYVLGVKGVEARPAAAQLPHRARPGFIQGHPPHAGRPSISANAA